MKMKVFKYTLEARSNVHPVPFGALILSGGQQNGQLCLWALVNPDERDVQIEITVVGTGWDVTGDPVQRVESFLGTVQVGAFVWHVFDTTLEKRAHESV